MSSWPPHPAASVQLPDLSSPCPLPLSSPRQAPSSSSAAGVPLARLESARARGTPADRTRKDRQAKHKQRTLNQHTQQNRRTSSAEGEVRRQSGRESEASRKSHRRRQAKGDLENPTKRLEICYLIEFTCKILLYRLAALLLNFTCF